MSRLSIYIETSIPSALHSTRESSFSTAARDATWLWWDTRRSECELYTSEAVEAELLRGSFPKQQDMLAVLTGIAYLALTPEVEELAERYVDRLVMPRLDRSLDAIHLAVACVYECDILLTWNIRHLANPNKVDHLVAVNAEDRNPRTPTGALGMSQRPKDIVDDVREARAKLAADYGNDLSRIFAALRAREREHPDKVVRRVKHVSYTIEPAFEDAAE